MMKDNIRECGFTLGLNGSLLTQSPPLCVKHTLTQRGDVIPPTHGLTSMLTQTPPLCVKHMLAQRGASTMARASRLPVDTEGGGLCQQLDIGTEWGA
jgi:hypothetical protein